MGPVPGVDVVEVDRVLTPGVRSTHGTERWNAERGPHRMSQGLRDPGLDAENDLLKSKRLLESRRDRGVTRRGRYLAFQKRDGRDCVLYTYVIL